MVQIRSFATILPSFPYSVRWPFFLDLFLHCPSSQLFQPKLSNKCFNSNISDSS